MLTGYEPIIQNITSGYDYKSSTFTTAVIPTFDISGNPGVTISGEFILETVSQIIGSCPVSFRYIIKMIDTLGTTYYIKWDINLQGPSAIFTTNNLTTDINDALQFERITYNELKNIAILANSSWSGFNAPVNVNQCWLRRANLDITSTFQYFKIHSADKDETGLLTLNDITRDIGVRYNEIQSWDILPTIRQSTGCDWNCELSEQTTLWTRATTDCIDLTDATLPDGQPMTRDDLSEKRKATIFQYKQNGAGFSKKQNYSRLARGLGRQRGQSFATQSDTYTNANTHNLPIVNNRVLSCPNVTKNWALTNQNDTPGPVRRITNYPTVPLTNYKVRRTYLAGGSKWPQYGWAPGNMGFPVGKKGNK
jgi:hypothetical protein